MPEDFLSKTLLIGVGANKAGTSWLWSQLNRRHDVFFYKAKEMHYFDAMFADQYGDRFRRLPLDVFKSRVAALNHDLTDLELNDLDARLARLRMTPDVQTYLDYFRQRVTATHVAFGEITPSYALLNAAGFTAMRDCHPDVRLIFLMRDPVDRFISSMRHDAALSGEVSTRDRVLSGLQRADMVARSDYGHTVQLLDSLFRPEKVLFGFYEAMFNANFMRQVSGFAGIEPIPAMFDVRVNASVAPFHADAELIETLRNEFARVYDFCRARFGDQIPPSWRT